jgi:hypothetical protein
LYTIESDNSFTKLSDAMPRNSMPRVIFSESEVANKLHKLKVNKSPGPDKIHPRILYELKDEIVTPLTSLFNLWMTTGILPDDWMMSTVSVLHKKGRKDCIENYRPISLTCICCKIMEGIVRDYVMDFFLANNLFSD